MKNKIINTHCFISIKVFNILKVHWYGEIAYKSKLRKVKLSRVIVTKQNQNIVCLQSQS